MDISFVTDSFFSARHVRKGEYNTLCKRLPKLLTSFSSRGQGFLDALDDRVTQDAVRAYASTLRKQFDTGVVLGIGGSALGFSCVFEGLRGSFWNMLSARKRGGMPRMFPLDNIDPEFVQGVEDVIDVKKTVFFVITKSGTTPETLAQFSYFWKKVSDAVGAKRVHEHFVFVTDPHSGFLRSFGKEHHVAMFPVPTDVGGRFSVLTAVGLFPAAFAGIDIEAMIRGAKAMRERVLFVDVKKNIAFQLAAMQYLLYDRGIDITVMMPYCQSLFRLADWYRQLLAESIGKAKDRSGKTVHVGVTPICALGATDQHSQVQLYNEGPADKFYLFADVGAHTSVSIPKIFDQSDVRFDTLLATEKRATEMAFDSYHRPHATIHFPSLRAETLGEAFVFLEMSVAFLGELFDVNAFDQPGVELAKTLTRKLLSRIKPLRS